MDSRKLLPLVSDYIPKANREKIDRLTYIHLPYQHMNISVAKDMRNAKLSKSIGGSTTLILLTASCKYIKKEVFIIFISSQDSAEIPCTMPNVFFQDELQRNTISLSCWDPDILYTFWQPTVRVGGSRHRFKVAYWADSSGMVWDITSYARVQPGRTAWGLN